MVLSCLIGAQKIALRVSTKGDDHAIRSRLLPSHFFVACITCLAEFLGLSIECFSGVWMSLSKGCIAGFALEEVFELIIIWFLGIEDEWVLTFLSEFWVVSPEVPVAAIHSFLDMGLSDAHTLADTVVDARSVSDDEGWTLICFCFFDGFDSLVHVGAETDLRNINVAIDGLHHAEVFLVGLLTSSSELSNSSEWGSLGSLTTGVGVNFGIEDEDVDVFAARTWSTPP